MNKRAMHNYNQSNNVFQEPLSVAEAVGGKMYGIDVKSVCLARWKCLLDIVLSLEHRH